MVSVLCSRIGLLTVLFGVVVCPLYAMAEDIDFTELSLEELSTVSLSGNRGSVLTSHIHKAGEWMIGYRFVDMHMGHNHDGRNEVEIDDVLADYPIAPEGMDMEMHMFSAMYAATNDLTIMAMLPYRRLEMDHVNRMGTEFTTESEGLGDLMLMANWAVLRRQFDRHLLTVMGGISLPTGSIDKRDDTPAGPRQILPYPMQLGSGTYDLLFGTSYVGTHSRMSWGAEARYTLRLGENDREYRFGNQVEVNAWFGRAWTNWISTSARIYGFSWEDVAGADPDLDPLMVPTADPNLRAGRRVIFLAGVELYAPNGPLQGQRLTFEVGVPVYKTVDGPQLQEDMRVGLGWQWSF